MLIFMNMPVSFPVIIYVLIIISCIISILRSDAPVLLKGNTLLRFHISFIFLTLLSYFLFNGGTQVYFFGFLIVLIIVSLMVRTKWFLLRCNFGVVVEILEKSFNMIIFSFRRIEEGYILENNGKSIQIRLQQILLGVIILSFEGKSKIKKVEVLQALLIKKFNKLLPRITIHI